MDVRSPSRHPRGNHCRKCPRGGKVVPRHGYRIQRVVDTQHAAFDDVEFSAVTKTKVTKARGVQMPGRILTSQPRETVKVQMHKPREPGRPCSRERRIRINNHHGQRVKTWDRLVRHQCGLMKCRVEDASKPGPVVTRQGRRAERAMQIDVSSSEEPVRPNWGRCVAARRCDNEEVPPTVPATPDSLAQECCDRPLQWVTFCRMTRTMKNLSWQVAFPVASTGKPVASIVQTELQSRGMSRADWQETVVSQLGGVPHEETSTGSPVARRDPTVGASLCCPVSRTLKCRNQLRGIHQSQRLGMVCSAPLWT